jgi:hypothetical protein
MDSVRLEDEIQTLQKARDLPVIHLLRANGDLLPEVRADRRMAT